MFFRMSQIGCAIIAVFVAMPAPSVQAQYAFGGQSCSNGYGYQGQSFYGQSGMFQNPGGSNFYMPGNYGTQNGYSPQQPLGYGGGYASPGLNVNQSFYPSGMSYNIPTPIQHHPSHHSHHSHHAWHLGHFLFGHQ